MIRMKREGGRGGLASVRVIYHIEGSWPSKNSYLRAHYELLREDSIAPLRDAVAYVRDEPKMMDSKEVSIYDMVCSRSFELEEMI